MTISNLTFQRDVPRPIPQSIGVWENGPLYKQTKEKYAEGMVSRGEFWIGTLYGFRDVERHGPATGDAGEGTRQVHADIDDGTEEDLRTSRFRNQFVMVAGGMNVNFQDVGMQEAEESPDCRIFCTSTTPTAPGLMELGDVCVTITDPPAFFAALTDELAQRHLVKRFVGFNQCVYATRRQALEQQVRVHPALLKGPEYASQMEVRAIWEPFDPAAPLLPGKIACEAAAAFLRIDR